MDRLDAAVDEVVRAALGILDGRGGRVDAEAVVQRGEHFLEFHRAIDGLITVLVGGADDLAVVHAAAGEEGKVRARPVVAAVVLVNLRGATELAPHHNGHVLVQAPFLEVNEQRGEPLIEQRHFLARTREVEAVAAMPIPAAVIECHHARAGLHEAAGDEEIANHLRRAVALILRNVHAVPLGNARVFLGDIQRIHQAGIGENAEGLRVVGIEAAHLAGVVGVAPELVNGTAQSVAVIQAIERNALELKALRLGEGILLHERHRCVRRADETAGAGLAPGAVAGGIHQRKIRRYASALVTLQLAHPRAPTRPAAVRRIALLALAPAGHALETIMRAIGISNGPNDRVLIGQLGQARELLADLDAGHVGLDGPKLAADLLGRLRLEVEEIQMRRTAG